MNLNNTSIVPGYKCQHRGCLHLAAAKSQGDAERSTAEADVGAVKFVC